MLAAITALAFLMLAPAAGDSMEPSEAAQLRVVKVHQEQVLEGRLGVPLFCHASLSACVRAYDRLARFEARGLGHAQRNLLKLIQVDSTSHAYDPKGESIIIAHWASVADMERLLKTAPAVVEGTASITRKKRSKTPLSAELVASRGRARQVSQGSSHAPMCPTNAAYYDRIFGDELFSVGIYLGYFDLKALGDNSPGSGKYEHHLSGLGQRVQERLRGRMLAQGFQVLERSEDGLRELFYAEFVHRGQDKAVVVELVNANTSCPDDQPVTSGIVHRGPRGQRVCAEQRALGRYAEQRYTQSLALHDATIYIGHARGALHEDGLLSVKARGPSFRPFWDKHNRISIQDGHLLEPRNWPAAEKLLYLNSCSSYQHYAEDVNELRALFEQEGERGLTFVGNRYKNSIRFYPFATAALLIGMLEHKCGPVIRKAMDHNINIYREHLTDAQRNYSLIDGELGNYNSFSDGHPRLRVDGVLRSSSTGARQFDSLAEISEIWRGGYLGDLSARRP